MDNNQRQELFNFIADLTGHHLMEDEINAIEYIVKGKDNVINELNSELNDRQA